MQRQCTALYYDLVQELMDRTGLHQRAAEQELVISTILRYQAEGYSMHRIAQRLQEMWGLNRSTYYRRLAKARRTICIP